MYMYMHMQMFFLRMTKNEDVGILKMGGTLGFSAIKSVAIVIS